MSWVPVSKGDGEARMSVGDVAGALKEVAAKSAMAR